ncbi:MULTISPECIES: hypothetical protein [Nesterenkonia]|uniref:Uncharacterized protein n=1 Tax=Nesterenkonia xinjiangensis TaxID=225327 RepID=A0A7Z0GL46_9MICC|nr:MULTISPECIES: hypothetical protein [Nesterenkonia]MDZ5076499.1 hypothetical protein [Nesterenkonia sp. HG001]NYJ77439.1 hypothetical protein [Nesterenkonia xinjiangensis]
MKYFPVAASALLSTIALVAGSWAGTSALTAVVCVICLVLSLGWPQLMGVTARRSLSTVILLAGVVAALGAAVVREVESLFFWSSVALAFGVMSVFVIQVLRGTGRPHRLESTLGASAGVVISTTAAGWVAGLRYPAELVGIGDSDDALGVLAVPGLTLFEDWALLDVTGTGGELSVVGLAAIGLGVSVLLACLPLRDALVLPLVVLGGFAGALGTALLWGELTLLFSGLLGLGAGALIAAMRRFLIVQGAPEGRLSAMAVGAAPIAGMGALVYFAERLLFV